jgi:hypothetical protein
MFKNLFITERGNYVSKVSSRVSESLKDMGT